MPQFLKKMSFVVLLIFLIHISSPKNFALAQLLESKQYKIDTSRKQLEMQVPSPTGIPLQIDYKDRQSSKPLGFSIDTDLIDFGPLTPGSPITRNIKTAIELGGNYSVGIFLLEDHPLSQDTITIADTTCDKGDCNEKLATPWINPLTYGFGYSVNQTDYLQFPNRSKNEEPQRIPVGQLTLKLNINKVQKQGLYQNTIRFIAVGEL